MRKINGDFSTLKLNPLLLTDPLSVKNISKDIILKKLKDDDGNLYRPHILWFDESYNEDLYKFDSSL